MYLPSYFKEDDLLTLVAFMRQNNFATLVSNHEGSLIASHIPLLVMLEHETVKLSGHVARANPHAQVFGHEMLVIFSGPHAYISPTLYEKEESVPTWNYIAVHAYGTPEAVTFEAEPERMLGMMHMLIASHEASYQQQWDGLSEKFRHGMMRGIVGFEMTVTRLEGKYKLSQNRSEMEQQTVAEALAKRADTTIAATGKLMKERLQK